MPMSLPKVNFLWPLHRWLLLAAIFLLWQHVNVEGDGSAEQLPRIPVVTVRVSRANLSYPRDTISRFKESFDVKNIACTLEPEPKDDTPLKLVALRSEHSQKDQTKELRSNNRKSMRMKLLELQDSDEWIPAGEIEILPYTEFSNSQLPPNWLARIDGGSTTTIQIHRHQPMTAGPDLSTATSEEKLGFNWFVFSLAVKDYDNLLDGVSLDFNNGTYVKRLRQINFVPITSKKYPSWYFYIVRGTSTFDLRNITIRSPSRFEGWVGSFCSGVVDAEQNSA